MYQVPNVNKKNIGAVLGISENVRVKDQGKFEAQRSKSQQD